MPKKYFNNHSPGTSSRVWVDDFKVADRDRRVPFKQSRYGNNKKERDWTNAVREHLQDEDVDMGINNQSGRALNKKFGRGKKGGKRESPMPPVKRKLLEGPTSWYKVLLPHADKYDKEFFLKLLLDKMAPIPLWPIAWQTMGNTAIFYVDDFKIAEKLYNLDRQIQLPNGFRQIIKVYHGSPNVDMNNTTKDKMKLAMGKRFNAANNALDLSKFHADPDLKDCFCALFKPIVFITVLEIIEQNIPQLEALNLDNNKISVLSFLKKIDKRLPHLKILHLSNNKLRDIVQLDALQGLPIVELILNGNPLCDKFKDQDSYISEVRKRFPKCVKLDGVDLPPPISFDIVDEQHVPETQQTFLCNNEGGGIVRQFLEQYFLIYDSDNRGPLLDAYHEEATFSLTMAYPYGYGKEKNVAWLNWYATDNRNLLRLNDSERRNKLLHQGKLAVVSFLREMPQTKHDMNSFTVDLTIFTPQMLCLVITGIFKELKSGHKIPPLRYFFRTLVIVPAGSGFCIVNDVLHVTNAIPEQAKEAFKSPPPIQAPPPSPISSPGPSGVSVLAQAVPVPDVPTDVVKQEMVKQMSLQSGMNLEWSMKCMEETQWDYQKALFAFQAAQARGTIPPEAFVK